MNYTFRSAQSTYSISFVQCTMKQTNCYMNSFKGVFSSFFDILKLITRRRMIRDPLVVDFSLRNACFDRVFGVLHCPMHTNMR